jgi:hypothetical protein
MIREAAVTWVCATVATGFIAVALVLAIALDAGLVAFIAALAPALVLGGLLGRELSDEPTPAEVSER